MASQPKFKPGDMVKFRDEQTRVAFQVRVVKKAYVYQLEHGDEWWVEDELVLHARLRRMGP